MSSELNDKLSKAFVDVLINCFDTATDQGLVRNIISFLNTISESIKLASKRSELINSFIDSLMHDRISFEDFETIYERLIKNSDELRITPADILAYFKEHHDWSTAPDLINLVTCDFMKFSDDGQLLVLNEIGATTEGKRSEHIESWKQFYPAVALMAKNNYEVRTLLCLNLQHIVENDNHVYYKAICDGVFDWNLTVRISSVIDLRQLYHMSGPAIKHTPGSKCSKLMYTTIQCIMEHSSREDYDKKIAEVLSDEKPVVSKIESKIETKIESALNIIEMVSNDIAALSLEAERINTCVRDAKSALM